jgi:hypothetical protein
MVDDHREGLTPPVETVPAAGSLREREEDEMAAIDQPAGRALNVREAAAACRLSPRTIRRKLNAGAFPNAFKTASGDNPARLLWKIPVSDLEQAGLEPTLVHPAFSKPAPSPESDTAAPTVLELVRSDRFGRLRAELAEAVAAAEIALLRAEAERWHVIADERAQALERADLALKALSNAMQSDGTHVAGTPTGPRADIASVPPLVRAEAMRYTATLQALHDMRKQEHRWWHFWR